MRRSFTHATFFFICFLMAAKLLAQNVGIGTTTPDASALLEINSASKGLLIPKMSAAQRNAIAAPATGLVVFQTDVVTGFYYNSGTAATPVWERLLTNASEGWRLNGNAGTNPATHYIGTNDAQGLHFKINNTHAGLLDSSNFFMGYKSGDPATSGTFNTALGISNLTKIDVGQYNVATGFQNLYSTTTGTGNVASGTRSLYLNTTGVYNFATGYQSLYFNSSGSNNIAAGYQSLYSNTTGTDNIALGFRSLYSNTDGSRNTAIGQSALLYNTASGNTAIGAGAMFSNTTGRGNTALGSYASAVNQTGSFNVAIGDSALFENIGTANTAIGRLALYINTSGNENTATGFNALRRNTTGARNTALGVESLAWNNTGNYNTATGFNSLLLNITGSRNTAMGYQSLNSNSTGGDNTAMGYGSLYFNTTGTANTVVGHLALLNNAAGSFNAALGAETLKTNTKGQKLLALGYKADVNGDSLVNATAIGANALVDCSNCLVLGSVKNMNGAAEDVNVGIGNSNPQAPLQFATDIRNRKIVLWSNQDNDNHFNGFGINPFVLRYQVNTVNDNHVFYAGTSPTTSNELMRISGNGNVGIGTSMPAEKLDVAGNAKIADTLTVAVIAQDPVQTLPLVNSWSNYGFGYEGAGFYKDRESRVHLSGLIKGGIITTGILLFQLPATARPAARLMFTVENNGSSGRIDILSNGDVLLMTATNNAFLNLTGISFRAD